MVESLRACWKQTNWNQNNGFSCRFDGLRGVSWRGAMSDLLDRDHFVRRFRRNAEQSLSPTVRRMYERAARRRVQHLHEAALTNEHEAFALLPGVDDGIDRGEILLGQTPAGMHVRLGLDALCCRTVILGIPGSGKSVLASRLVDRTSQRGVWVFATDAKSSPTTVLRHGVPMLGPAEATLTMATPPGFSENTWLTMLLWLFESTLYLSYGSQHIRRAYEAIRQRCESDSICLTQLAALVHSRIRRTKGNYKELSQLQTAAMVLDRLSKADLGLFSSTSMVPWKRRLRRSHGVWLRGVPAESGRIFTLATLYAAIGREHALNTHGSRQLRSLFVLDDARTLVRSAGHHQQTSGTDPFLHAVDVGQSAGLGTVVVIQNLDELDPGFLVGADNLILCGPVDMNDVNKLRHRLQLTPEQADYLAHQPRYHALVHLRSHEYSYAFPVQLAGPEHCLSEDEARTLQVRNRQQLLAGFKPSKWAPQTEPIEQAEIKASSPEQIPGGPASPHCSSVQLDPQPHRCLVTILHNPWLLQSELAKIVGIGGRVITSIRNHLEQRGYVKQHKLGRYVLWEPLEVGATAVGMKLRNLAGRGSYAHRWLQARIEAWLEQQAAQVKVEAECGHGRIDVLATMSDGSRTAYEIMLSDGNLVTTLDKLAELDASSSVVVCVDTEAARRIQRLIDESTLFVSRKTTPTLQTIAQIVKASARYLSTVGENKKLRSLSPN
jgi:hypothetical protein